MDSLTKVKVIIKSKNVIFERVIFDYNFHTVFLRIRVENLKSQRAALKLPYVVSANESHPTLLTQVNSGEAQFNLFKIPKDLFYLTTAHQLQEGEEQAM